MKLYSGRPENNNNREEREIRVYDYLDKLEIPYSRTDHEAAETMEVCKAIDEVLGAKICKNLFLCNRQKTVFYLLLMPGDKPFKTKELSSQINSARLSFATPDKMLEYLDIKPGAVRDILKDEYIGCHPCVNTSSIKIKTDDLINKYLPSVNHAFTTVKLIGE